MTTQSPVLVIPSSVAGIGRAPLCAAQTGARGPKSVVASSQLPALASIVPQRDSEREAKSIQPSVFSLSSSSSSLDTSTPSKSNIGLAQSPSAASQSSATSRSPNSAYTFLSERPDNSLSIAAMQSTEESLASASDSPRSDIQAAYETEGKLNQLLNQRATGRPASFNPADSAFTASQTLGRDMRPTSLAALLREAQNQQDLRIQSQQRPSGPGPQVFPSREYANLKTLAAAAAVPSGQYQHSGYSQSQMPSLNQSHLGLSTSDDELSSASNSHLPYRSLGMNQQHSSSLGPSASNAPSSLHNNPSHETLTTATDFASTSYLLPYPHLSPYVTQPYAAAAAAAAVSFPFQQEQNRSASPVAPGSFPQQPPKHFLGYPPRMPLPLYPNVNRNPYPPAASFANRPQTSAAFSTNNVDRAQGSAPNSAAYPSNSTPNSLPVMPMLPMFQTPSMNHSYLPPFTQNAPAQTHTADLYQIPSHILAQSGASSITVPNHMNRFAPDMPPVSYPSSMPPALQSSSSSVSYLSHPPTANNKPKKATTAAERFTTKKKPASSSSSSSSKSSRARRERSHSSDSTSTSSSLSNGRSKQDNPSGAAVDDEKGSDGGGHRDMDEEDEEEFDDEEDTDEPEEGEVPGRAASGSSKGSSSSERLRKSKAGGNRKYGCEICHKQFYQSSNLVTHYRTHTGERPFACTFEGCGRSFTQSSNLKRHLRVHSGEKPFECSECGKKCSRRASLVAHFRVHTGEKPFECPVCQKRFSIKNSLMVHQRTHIGKPQPQSESPS